MQLKSVMNLKGEICSWRWGVLFRFAWIIIVVVLLQGCGGAENGTAERTVILDWVAPSVRENGMRLHLHELDHYVIRYGRSLEMLDRTLVLPDPLVQRHTLTGLEPGEWFFSVYVVDKVGQQSRPSNIVHATL